MLKDLKAQIPKINEQTRVSPDLIQSVVDHIVQTFDPEKIILFGSHAYGEPKPGSDVDLLVVLETDKPREKQKEIRQFLLSPFSLDILVWTPQEIAQRIPLGDFFLREIITKGRILYEREKTPLQWGEVMESPQTGPNSYVLEWIQKAEGDFEAAAKLSNLQQANLTDAVCFHCQQCAEKYAKAYLVHNMIEFPRTHDLLELQSYCQNQDVTFAAILPQMGLLNNYSVHIRYPGRFTSLEEAKGTVEAMNTVRILFRSKLNL